MMNLSHTARTLFVAAVILLSPQLGPADQRPLRSIDHFFKLVDVEREGGGYYLTIANNSNRAFSHFVISVQGVDISRITVYRKKIEVSFMEGQSERTFYLPEVDERVFKIDIDVFDRVPQFY